MRERLINERCVYAQHVCMCVHVHVYPQLYLYATLQDRMFNSSVAVVHNPSFKSLIEGGRANMYVQGDNYRCWQFVLRPKSREADEK